MDWFYVDKTAAWIVFFFAGIAVSFCGVRNGSPCARSGTINVPCCSSMLYKYLPITALYFFAKDVRKRKLLNSSCKLSRLCTKLDKSWVYSNPSPPTKTGHMPLTDSLILYFLVDLDRGSLQQLMAAATSGDMSAVKERSETERIQVFSHQTIVIFITPWQCKSFQRRAAGRELLKLRLFHKPKESPAAAGQRVAVTVMVPNLRQTGVD